MITHRKVLMITTGGTIAGNVAKPELEQSQHLSGEDFKKVIKFTAQSIYENWGVKASVETFSLDDLDSSNINHNHWKKLAIKIKEEYDSFDAFIVTHGTNTLGYTSAALSFALTNLNKPVILTGSQVPFGQPGSDAIVNLENAIRVAVWPYHQIKGVITVFGSRIISGVRTKKTTDFDYDAFRSFSFPSLGLIGRVINMDQENLEKHNSYSNKSKTAALKASDLEIKAEFNMNVISLTEFPGMSKSLFKSLVENQNVKGFILRSFGAGDPSYSLHESFEYLKVHKIPLVITTQAPNGNSNLQVNEPGKILKSKDLAIPSYDMSIESITTKLSWLLGQNLEYNIIKNEMLVDYHGELSAVNDLK